MNSATNNLRMDKQGAGGEWEHHAVRILGLGVQVPDGDQLFEVMNFVEWSNPKDPMSNYPENLKWVQASDLASDTQREHFVHVYKGNNPAKSTELSAFDLAMMLNFAFCVL
ncbi:hypothetical protein JCM16303_000407 [Sporobolomyces ruberrimus]